MDHPGKWVCFLMGVGVSLTLAGAAVAAPQRKPQPAAVQELSSRGVLRGYPDGKYVPEKPVTRLELAIIVARLLRAIESNPAAAQPPDPLARPVPSVAFPAGVPAWARGDYTFLAQRGYSRALPYLSRDLRRSARQADVVAALRWALASVAERGYIPPGDLAAPPPEPSPKP